MFTIEHIQNKGLAFNYIELKDTDNNSCAKIFLNQGGSLQELTLMKKSIIKDLRPLNYDVSYASSILFPFANRIKNGTYTFEQKKYELELNDKEENNAIHGLVFNKIFKVLEQKSTNSKAYVKLMYTGTDRVQGFPFVYSIQLLYTLTKDLLTLKVSVKNDDIIPFPFSIGWHPYFFSKNLYNSFLTLESNKKLSFDKKMIPVKITDVSLQNDLQIKDRKFDDCYILSGNDVYFKTPDYTIVINSSAKENYLQLYTPNKANTIAIEPISGPSNSFNNKLGLQVLDPGETYQVNWSIKLKENE